MRMKKAVNSPSTMTFVITEEIRMALQTIGASEQRSLSFLVRNAIESWLAGRKGPSTAEIVETENA